MKAGEILATFDAFAASEPVPEAARDAITVERRKLKRFEAAFGGRKMSEATMKRILHEHQSLSVERKLYSQATTTSRLRGQHSNPIVGSDSSSRTSSKLYVHTCVEEIN